MVQLGKTGLAAWRLFLRLKNRLVVLHRKIEHDRTPADRFVPRFSIVSPVYNVDRYLETYLVSIVIQQQFCTGVELILVDDGSTDGSAAILEKWRRRFPHNITVIRQSNAGQSVARNTGLRHATARWVTFIDPDDFVERDYLARVARFIRRHDRARDPLNFVSCRHITYNEAGRQFIDNHPLRRRFDHDAVLPVSNPGAHIQLHVNSVFFRRSLIEASHLRFDARVRPCFEDAHFVARYMMRCTNGTIGFVRGARYYYRKRADGSSTLDTSVEAPERFDDLYRYGYIALLREAHQRFGAVPRWLQRTVLYDITWQIRRYVDNEEKLAFLDARQLKTYKALLRQALQPIASMTISRFELAGIRELHRIGMLGAFKAVHDKQSYCFIHELDADRGTFVLRWYASLPGSRAAIQVDGVDVAPLEHKEQIHTLMHAPFFYENRVRIRRSTGVLTVDVDGRRFSIDAFGNRARPSIDLAAMFEHHSTIKPPVDITRREARMRRISQSDAVRRKYDNAWLLMDRDTEADDNAEHLYRHLQRTRRDINAFFVLRRDSRDWSRLEAEGIRLIPFGSPDHAFALLNARYLISSHADIYVWNYLPRAIYGDLLKYKFVFLQHGVTSNDLASWINSLPIDLILTCSEREYESMAGRSNRYRLMPSQVALTGFPRHDALLNDAAGAGRHILIMPTWRSSLVGPRIGNSTERKLIADFDRTEYARAWKALLHAPRLKALVENHGYRVTFFPHTNVEPYLPCFEVPDHIDVQSRAAGASIQAAFKSARLLVTDYSSVAFEAAMIGRAVLYYQFDRDRIFSGIHTIRPGYFDFDRDGFGPVCRSHGKLLEQIERVVANDGRLDARYAARARRAFRWRDGNACGRAVQAIEKLTKPVIIRRAVPMATVEAIAPASVEPPLELSHASG